jgi:hypothetical protein
VNFRTRLIGTLRALRPIFDEDVLVIGSEVPNLLEGGRTVVIVSQHIDIGVPVTSHSRVRERLRELDGLRASAEEPSVWLPEDGREDRMEVNFVGMDPALDDIADSYVLDDDVLPLLVLGNLSLLERGERVDIEGVHVPLPEPTSLLIEKLLTERSGIKGDRDLLVALALITSRRGYSEARLRAALPQLQVEDVAAIRANLAVLSLMEGQPDMPDPTEFRRTVLAFLEVVDEATR